MLKHANNKLSLGIGMKLFQPGVHICLLYRNEQERRETVSKYLRAGLINHEKIGYFTDIMNPVEIQKWLSEAGVEISQDNLTSKQITITPALEVYCPTGKFETQNMLTTLGDYYEHSLEEGFTGARVTGETDWISPTIPGCDHFIEYEAQINNLIKKKPVTVMCQYDVTQFDGTSLFDILQVHPLLIIRGQVLKNPAYIKPEAFIKEFRNR